ncbi:MAG: GGDEF domain-containing protein [Sulfuricella sp.]|nr:GGDEF domain-containing protein [Sulfuricella sp.]
MFSVSNRDLFNKGSRRGIFAENEHPTLSIGNVSYKKRRAAALGNAAPTAEKSGTVGVEALAVRAHLHEIVEKRLLSALFQPIVDLHSGRIFGFEGLIRGPSDSPLHAPVSLFRAAQLNQLSVEVEHLCRRVVLERYAELALPGKLFLNVSPECLIQHGARSGETLAYMARIGIEPEQVIIELTESQPTYDYDLLRKAVEHYRNMGFSIAMDDLGEGFSGLRLWSELRPEYVKIDMHFVQGIPNDPVKLQFVRSIQEIAEKSDCLVIAEGIETQAELVQIHNLNIAYGQGYHIARPNPAPTTTLPAEVAKTLGGKKAQRDPDDDKHPTAAKLLRKVTSVTPETPNEVVYEIFNEDPEIHALPVVDGGRPVGLINRYKLIDGFTRPFRRELYGKKPCAKFMDPAPLVVEKDISIQELSNRIVEAETHHLSNGFIITDNGQYLGLGTGHDLVREITDMQINAARYANPLTLLPGNVPIDEHIERLLQSHSRFCVCYCDLDHFKPFNDVYGYHRGDEVIQLTAKVLSGFCDPTQDFIGHVGGDDFIILFQSADWESRCQNILTMFGECILNFFSNEDRERGGYVTEDRQGKKVFHPLTSLSLGVVKVEPGQFRSLHQVAAAAAEAKKQAKKIPGNALFVERREG